MADCEGAGAVAVHYYPHSSCVRHDAWDDSHHGSVPLLHIDGREITWQDFGRMLMTFEGWQFKLEIRDKSEEF